MTGIPEAMIKAAEHPILIPRHQTPLSRRCKESQTTSTLRGRDTPEPSCRNMESAKPNKLPGIFTVWLLPPPWETQPLSKGLGLIRRTAKVMAAAQTCDGPHFFGAGLSGVAQGYCRRRGAP